MEVKTNAAATYTPELTDVEEEFLLKELKDAEFHGRKTMTLAIELVKNLHTDMVGWALASVNAEELRQQESAVARARNMGSQAALQGVQIDQCPLHEDKQKLAWVFGWETARALQSGVQLQARIAVLESLLVERAVKEGL